MQIIKLNPFNVTIKRVTKCILSVPLLRVLVTGRSPQGSGFSSGQVPFGCVVDKKSTGMEFSLSSSVFPCLNHCTNASYSFCLPSTLHDLGC
jgi:hypothetical protein